MNSPARLRPAGRLVCLLVFAAATAACSHSNKDSPDRPDNPFKVKDGPGAKAPLSDRELRLEADKLYKLARKDLESSDFDNAITHYDQISARYPFTEYATQAEMEKIYALYRSYKADDAVSAADRYLREHPRNPNADYVLYLKGLTDYDRDSGLLDVLSFDTSKKDVSSARRAFDDFALLMQRYPKSRYLGDARRRMLYLRNRVAAHELSVAKFYVSRGAYVAAAKRAEDIVAEYPGAPATLDALKILEQCYRQLGLQQQAGEAAQLIAANAVTPQVETPHFVAAEPPPRLPALAEAAPAPTAGASAPGEKGFFSRLAGWFDIFDTSKPEHQYTVVLPTGAGSANAPATAQNGSGAATQPGTAAAPSGDGSHVHVTVEYPEWNAPDATAAAKSPAASGAASTAPPASTSSDPSGSAAGSAAPAQAGDKAQQVASNKPEDKRGLLTRFACLFSFLSSEQREQCKAEAEGRQPDKPAAPGS